MSVCTYAATGEHTCSPSLPKNIVVEEWGDPATDPNCAAYGCAEGRTCASTSDCANGLSCRNAKCTRFNPFTRSNLEDERRQGPVGSDGREQQEHRHDKGKEEEKGEGQHRHDYDPPSSSSWSSWCTVM